MNSSRPRAVLNRCLEAAVIAIIAALALLVIVGVASRKAGFSLVWYDEVAAILLAWLTYYGAALAALHRAHLGFPNLVQLAPRDLRFGLVVLRELAIFLFFGLTAYLGLDLLSVLGGTFLVSLPWLPAAVVYSAIPVGAMLFIAAELITAVEDWNRGINR
ncbi:MAG: TRAP transporter small permease subunit [Bryobacterales bacterium]|nr:TRAP transporter small permease subunit [Bryobacterales bacterium]